MADVEIQMQAEKLSVRLTQRVKNMQDYLIAKNPKNEISWYGSVIEDPEGHFIIDDIFVPEQVCSAATTRATDEGFSKLFEEMKATQDGQDKLGRLYYWGHSHVNMGVSPSGQDVETLGSLVMRGFKRYLRGIFNLRGESTMYLCQDGDYFSAAVPITDVSVLTDLSSKDIEYMERVLTENVKTTVATEYVVTGDTKPTTGTPYFTSANPLGKFDSSEMAARYNARRQHFAAQQRGGIGQGQLFAGGVPAPTQYSVCEFDCDNCANIACRLRASVLKGGGHVGVQAPQASK